MPPRTTTPPSLNYNKSSPGASSTGFEFPRSPSLQSVDGFRQRSASPRKNSFFSEKKPQVTDLPSPRSPQSPVRIKPYIGLRSKLSLAWVNYTVVALMFIILRLFIAMKSIGPLVDDVKDKAIQSCDALEVATSTVTSLPHFMADGFNRATVDSVNFTIKGAAKTLDLLIVGIEGIIIWLIHVFRSTYRCILEFALKASIGSVSESVRVLGDFTQGKLNDIKSQVDSQVSSANSALDQIRNTLNSVSFAGANINIPTVTVSTDPLNNFQLPTSNIVSGLDSFNGDIPSMDQIETDISNLISIPFNQLRGFVSDSMSNLNFNQTALPVPPKNQISFCAQSLDLGIFDDIARDLIKAAYIGLGIIFVIVLLMIAFNALEIWISHIRYKLHISRTTTTIKLVTMKPEKDSVIEVLKIAEHPLILRWIIKCSRYFKNLENRNLFRWFFDYILHKPALICLLIGLAGVMGIYLQIAILHAVKEHYKQPIANAVGDFGNSVTNLINSQLNATSTQFASDSNNVIGTLETGINQDLFGWVNITTTTLNNTLNSAVDEITNFVQTTFQGVPIFATIVQELINCLIVVKVEGIQAGLIFIRENAFIGLPRVNDTVLLLSQGSTDEAVGQVTSRLVGPSSPSDIKNGNGEIGGEIGKLFDTYENNLRAELPLFYTLILIWFVVILMGIIRVLWFIHKRRKYNKNKKDSESAQSMTQQNDLSQLSKSIKDEDESKFDAFRFKMKSLKNNRFSQKKLVNPTFPRNYRPPQPDDKDHDDGNNNNKQRRPPPPPPPLPTKPIRLQRHDIRNSNPFENDKYNYF